MVFTSIAAKTDLGLVRQKNEDSALYSNSLIAIGDGMGGAIGGEIASRLAIHLLSEFIPLLTSAELDEDSKAEILRGALLDVDNKIASYIKERDELVGMGTTLTALSPIGKFIALLHIGDSRAYRIRGKEILQLSQDHTVVQELFNQDRIKKDEIKDHPQRSMLTQVLMGRGIEDPILQLFPVEKSDLFLLCSDGLSNVLDDQEILSIVLEGSIESAANNLITAVRSSGAPDNVTVVLARIDDLVDSDLEKNSEIIEFLGAAHG
jgi:PPM family protein phosphatase